MIEVYYHVPAEKAEITAECGMKLSEWYDREVVIGGECKKSISALLNPRDDYAAYRSGNYRCVKLKINPGHCYVADRFLYRLGLNKPEAARLYERSVIPVEEYMFGIYRMPECLITCTVVGGLISLLDRRLDSPVLFESSEELYFNNLIEGMKDANNDFNDSVMYYFLDALAKSGKVIKIEDATCGMAAFEEEGGRVYTVRIPDVTRYTPPGIFGASGNINK